MLKIGITGGIGSGKSIVAQIFFNLGAPVYYADIRAKYLLNHNETIIKKVINTFGSAIYLSKNNINKNLLSEIVFNAPEKLKTLNSIIHPEVFKDFLEWSEKQKNKFPYLLKEAALMFESDAFKLVNKVVCVTCPEVIRIQRILGRDKHITEEEVKSRIKYQLPEEEKIKNSDYVIVNDGATPVLPQVLKLHELFVNPKSIKNFTDFRN